MISAVVVLMALAQADGGEAPDGGVDAGTRWQLEIVGERALPETVYRLMLGEHDEHFDGDPEDARARAALFLERAGYELAKVGVRTDGGTLTLEVDEGRVEKLVVRGPLTLPRLRLRLLLQPERSAFNRPQLEADLDRMVRDVGGARPRLELVPSERRAHFGIQLDTALLAETAELIGAQKPYELHLVFPDDEWPRGLALDVRITYYDGLELGLRQQGEDLLFEGDRARVQASGGVGLRQEIDTNAPYFAFSRSLVEAYYATPKLLGPVRLEASIDGEALARQRRDLRLENYQLFTANARLGGTWQFLPRGKLSIVGGVRGRIFRGLIDASGGEVMEPVEPAFRPFLSWELSWVISADPYRTDRSHEVSASVRRYFDALALTTGGINELRAAWRMVRGLGWHDVVLQARAAWLTGDVTFHDEEPVGGLHLREAPGQPWSRAAVSASAEFRFSLIRDFLKLSAFVDAAVFGEIDRDTGIIRPRVGTSLGPGINVLAGDFFQIDGYLAFGFLPGGRWSASPQLRLIKVF